MQATSDPLPDLSWDDVRLFLVLSRSRTMGQAAEALDVDPSTVSRRLVGLEESLDTVLFDRGREGLRPTHAAEELLPTAEIAEDGIARFAGAAAGLERDVSGLVRTACPPDAAEVFVPPILRDLLARHPRLRVALEPGEAIANLSRREADLALRVVRPTHGDLLVKRVLRITWQAAATAELGERLGHDAGPADLPWIGWGERRAGTPAGRWVEAVARAEPVFRSDQLTAQVAAARAGIGVALLPTPSIAHHGLVPVDLGPESTELLAQGPADELFLVTYRALAGVPRVRALWDALAEGLDPAGTSGVPSRGSS